MFLPCSIKNAVAHKLRTNPPKIANKQNYEQTGVSDFLPAKQALGISERISGKISGTSFQISRSGKRLSFANICHWAH